MLILVPIKKSPPKATNKRTERSVESPLITKTTVLFPAWQVNWGFADCFIVKMSGGGSIRHCRHLALKCPFWIQPYSRRVATPVGRLKPPKTPQSFSGGFAVGDRGHCGWSRIWSGAPGRVTGLEGRAEDMEQERAAA